MKVTRVYWIRLVLISLLLTAVCYALCTHFNYFGGGGGVGGTLRWLVEVLVVGELRVYAWQRYNALSEDTATVLERASPDEARRLRQQVYSVNESRIQSINAYIREQAVPPKTILMWTTLFLSTYFPYVGGDLNRVVH